MMKDKFLKELEKKLSILTELEKKDIIDEYRDIIEEKIKHGKTEEEAVKEFGNIDKLTDEILSAYKINPEFNKKKESSASDFVGECEDFIKKGANKLAEVTEEIVDNFKKNGKDFTLESVFELVLKVIIFLLFLAVLRIPFAIVASLGSSLFDSSFIFIGSGVGGFIWKLLTEIIYIVVCILLFVVIVKKWTDNKVSNQSNVEKAEPVAKKKETKTSTTDEIINEKKDSKTNKKVPTNHASSQIITTLLRIFIIFVMVIPLVFVYIAALSGLIISIYLIFKGVYVVGILLLCISACIFLGALIDILSSKLFNGKRIRIYPFIISFILFVIGSLLTVEYFLGFTYYNKLPEDVLSETIEKTIETNEAIVIDYDKIVIDNTMENNKIKVEARYYYLEEYYYENIEINTFEPDCDNCYKHLVVDYDRAYQKFNLKELFTDKFVEILKEQKIYNYEKLNDIDITIYVNENTKDLVKD